MDRFILKPGYRVALFEFYNVANWWASTVYYYGVKVTEISKPSAQERWEALKPYMKEEPEA